MHPLTCLFPALILVLVKGSYSDSPSGWPPSAPSFEKDGLNPPDSSLMAPTNQDQDESSKMSRWGTHCRRQKDCYRLLGYPYGYPHEAGWSCNSGHCIKWMTRSGSDHLLPTKDNQDLPISTLAETESRAAPSCNSVKDCKWWQGEYC